MGSSAAASGDDVFDLSGDFPCCSQRGDETRRVTLPLAASCAQCVLQWFWTGDGPYFNCADVAVRPTGELAPPAPDSGAVPLARLRESSSRSSWSTIALS